MTRPALTEIAAEELAARVEALGGRAFHARSARAWVFRRGARAWRTMTDLPKPLRERLAESVDVCALRVAGSARAPDGTVKLLLEARDGERIEAAAIPTGRRLTACVSTQVGCAFRCPFCASGAGGLVRDLSAGEIAEQILHASSASERAATNVVLMGVGEPLANLAGTLGAVRLVRDELGLGARRVTVSTIGLVEGIAALGREAPGVRLAVSLHAPTDELRRRLLPHAPRTPLAGIVEAADRYARDSGRWFTVEYTLLGGANDGEDEARALARLLSKKWAKVNLIPLNPGGPGSFEPPAPAAVRAFARLLKASGLEAPVRRARGLGAGAACGQLRRSRGGDKIKSSKGDRP